MSETEQGEITHRRLGIPQGLWGHVLKLSASSGIDYQDLVVQLLQDGILVRCWESERFGSVSLMEKQVSPLTKVVLEADGVQLGTASLPSVPEVDETVTWKGRVYTVQERAWALGLKENMAYLRMAEWKKG